MSELQATDFFNAVTVMVKLFDWMSDKIFPRISSTFTFY